MKVVIPQKKKLVRKTRFVERMNYRFFLTIDNSDGYFYHTKKEVKKVTKYEKWGGIDTHKEFIHQKKNQGSKEVPVTNW